MLGILVEKPSAARNFASALGGMKGTFNGESYVIVAARGHLFELAGPDEQVAPGLAARYKSWKLDNLPWTETDFTWKRVKKKDTAQTLRDIKAGLSGCDEIAIATDVDPTGEGELLAWEILDDLKLRPKKFSRFFFIDESKPEVQKAFKTRKPIQSMRTDMDYVKAFYRTRFDFLTMQFTRIATAHGDGKAVLRQGRLKSAMVLIVGDQLAKRAAYQKIPFYQNRFRDENGVVYTNPEEPMFPDKSQVPQSYHPSSVTCDGKTMKSSVPPKMLDLATMSGRLAGKHKAKDVLATYQKMYEDLVVSYPRTEDKVISPEQFNELLPLVDKIAKVVGVDAKLLTHRKPRPTHVKAGGAHGANRPGKNVPNSLQELAAKYGQTGVDIYTLLARNYLATLAEDYEYENQKGHVTDYPKFVGSVNVPKKLGWKAVYNTGDDDDDLSQLGLGTKAEPFVYEGFPPQPQQPTMKWLMAQLEKHDVGTGATRTSIYADVTNEKAKYPLLKETKGKLSMTEFGDMSYRLLPGTHIGDLKLTEQMQANMRGIAEGKLNPEACLQEVRQMVIDDIKTMEVNGQNMRKELGKTMQTGAGMQKEKYTGQWNGHEVSFNREWGGHRFTDEECEALCNGEEITLTLPSRDGGGTYDVTGKLANMEYNGRKYVGFQKQASGSGGTQSGPERYTGKWKRKEVSFKREWGGHRFTDEECEALCNGQEITITGIPKKDGSGTYGVKGKLANLEYNGHKYVGFQKTGFADDVGAGGQPKLPASWSNYTFTEDERIMLEDGKHVRLEGLTSKKGTTYGCVVRFGKKRTDGRWGIIPEFDKENFPE